MNYEDAQQSEEIDFKSLLASINRGKKYILLITFLSTLFGSIFAFRATPIWLGTFNIVISENNNNKSFAPINIPGLVNDKSETTTQKLILKSPSVLMPVYEYVKNYYSENGEDASSMTFKSWIKNDIKIDFRDGSNVLSIDFKNKDKKLILSTLSLISKRYQDYSRKDQEKNIIDTLEYLKKQEKIMSEKALVSKKEFNKFSIDNGLGNIDGFVKIDNNNIDLQLANQIPNENLDLLKQISNQRKISSSSGSSAGQRYKTLFAKLEAYELLYTDLSAKLKPNSQYLNSIKVKKENLEKSLKRPNKILLKYQELKRKSQRNESLLATIQNNLELMRLEQIKTPNAWELISTPTLDKNKVFPKERRIIFIFFSLSILLSSILVILKEKLSGIIYEVQNFKQNLDCKYLETIKISEQNLNNQIIENLYNFSNNDKNNNLGIINKTTNKNLLSSISDNSRVIEVDFNDKKKINKCNRIVLIFEGGNLNNSDLKTLNKFVNLHKNKILGWLFLEKNI